MIVLILNTNTFNVLLHDRDHLCTDKPVIPRDACGKVKNEDTGGPLSIEERDGR